MYVGSGLPAAKGHVTEPALVDPRLGVDTQPCERPGKPLPYWPAYDRLTPAQRAGYLRWLAAGRVLPEAPLGYVFLYFYGLERRLLVDTSAAWREHPERELILAEIRRLLSIYGRHRSFRDYAARLLGTCVALGGPPRYRFAPPRPPSQSRELPIGLRLGLGQLVTDELPISAEWALAWWLLHPATRPRVPVRQCPDEFTETFTEFYTEKFGDGLLLENGGPRLGWAYHPASVGIDGPFRFEVDVPDVAAMTTAFRHIDQVAQRATNALAVYSRLLSRYPDAAGTPQATALLPTFQRWTTADADAGIDADANAGTASDTDSDTHTDTAPNAGPDLGGIPEARPVPDHGAPDVADPVATVVLPVPGPGGIPGTRPVPGHGAPDVADPVATVVLPVPGPEGIPETRSIPGHGAPDVADPVATVVLPGTPAGHFALPPRPSSAEPAAVLPPVPGSVSVPAPECPAPVARPRVEAAPDASIVGESPTRQVVPRADGGAGRVARRRGSPGDTAEPQQPTTPQPPVPASPPFRLDRELLAAKAQESERVGALLGSIFADTTEAPVQPRPASGEGGGSTFPVVPAIASAVSPVAVGPVAVGQGNAAAPVAALVENAVEPGSSGNGGNPAGQGNPGDSNGGVVLVPGLDEAHSALLAGLRTAPVWSRNDFAALAATFHLLPDGALDTLNEAAVDVAGEPVCEGGDPIEMNAYALEEMFG